MTGAAIGARIRRLRIARGLSLQGVAKPAGISKVYLWQIEEGSVAAPSGAKLLAVTHALEVPLGALLGAAPGEVDVLPALAAFLDAHAEIPPKDRAWLARVEHRGRWPGSTEDFAYVYEGVRRACRGRAL